MKYLNFLLYLFLSILIAGCGGSEKIADTPENLLGMLSDAVKVEAGQKAENCFSTEAWKNRSNSCERLFKQAVRKKLDFKLTDVKQKEKKAVVTADILRSGKRVDTLFFYAARSNDLWKFEGFNENSGHPALYLEGKLPARFQLSSYPDSSELKALGTKLIELATHLSGVEKEEVDRYQTQTETVLTGDAKSIYSKLRLLIKVASLELKVTASHWVAEIQRGGIIIKDADNKEKVFLYVKKGANGFELIGCTVGWLSEESLLR